MRRALVASLVLAVVVAGCLGASPDGGTPGDGSPTDGGDGPPPEPTLRAHRFAPVGTSVPVEDMGTILEVASLEPADGVLGHDEGSGTVRCEAGGTGFVRARYRPADVDRNRVQTMVVVCVDETGTCDDQPRVAVDLERYLDREPRGEANLLAQGTGDLYGVCRADDAVRLQQAPPMPPLMLRIIDAFGEGAYAMGPGDIPLVRDSRITTFSGERITPPWITPLSLETTDLTLRANGSVAVEADPCTVSPGCTLDPRLVRDGDVVSLGFGAPPSEGLRPTVEEAEPDVVEGFVEAHVDVNWSTTEDLLRETREAIVFRLLGLEVMDQVMDRMDEAHDLRGKDVQVAYDPYWQTRARVTDLCHPDARPTCRTIEGTLDAYERERIDAWRTEGFDLWYAATVAYDRDGTHAPLNRTAPSVDAFPGALLLLDPGRPLDEGDRATAMADALRGTAQELGTTPVVLTTGAGPMRFAIEDAFCEAEICVSALSDYYDVHEASLQVMRTAFAPGQVRGFGVALFEGGSHFDIREPYEERAGSVLNRVGETGYNSPLMNLYLAR